MNAFPETAGKQAGAGFPPPILVTGAPRSGTTWAGNLIGLDAGSGDIYEPFNPRCPKGRCRAEFKHIFTYITCENETPYLEPLADTLSWKYSLQAELRSWQGPRSAAGMLRDLAYFSAKRRHHARAVVKDPGALFAAAWLADRFGARVLVIIRHPAAFVASLRAAGWGNVPFGHIAGQPGLLAERLEPFADAIRAAAKTRPDPIEGGTLLWKILNHHVAQLREEHPDWIFVRHEDLSRDPLVRFRDIYGQLGLHFTPEVLKAIRNYSENGGLLAKLSPFSHKRKTVRNSTENILSFRKRLSKDELDRIRRSAAPVSDIFYGDEFW
jgi:hypothetical protein